MRSWRGRSTSCKRANCSWGRGRLPRIRRAEKAIAEAAAAARLEPDNITAQLTIVGLRLHQTAEAQQMAEVSDRLDKIQKLVERMDNYGEKRSRWRELTLNLAIWNGLNGFTA